jgi:hypothetical protein
MSEIITDLGFDSKSLWQPKNFEPHPFPESTWPFFKGLNLKLLTEIEGQDMTPLLEIDRPMTFGTIRPYGSDKIEKLTTMWVLISKSIAGGFWMGWPNDDYDFPALVLAWEESKKRLHVIIDVMPLVDCVEYPEYREKYLDGIDPVYMKYRDLIGLPSTYNWFRAQSGPYHIFDGPGSQREKSLQCEVEYGKYWSQVVQKAEPMEDGPYKQYVNKRKKMIMDQLRKNDPLGAVLIRTMGNELGRLAGVSYT